jgi:hypothetical protein
MIDLGRILDNLARSAENSLNWFKLSKDNQDSRRDETNKIIKVTFCKYFSFQRKFVFSFPFTVVADELCQILKVV